jgi:hypothetical protein
MAKYPVVGSSPGEVEVPDNPSGGGGTSSSGGESNYQWSWNMVHVDPPHYTRVMSGKGKGIPIAKGKYPVNYRVANGQPGGGYATGESNGTLPIKLILPTKGTGRCHCVTQYKVLVINKSSSVRKFCIGLGVSDPSEVPQPMRDYLGSAHDLGVWEGQMSFESIGPGESRTVVGFRLDIIDNDFSAVQGWPNWELKVNPDSKLWPGVVPLMTVESGELEVGDAFLIGYAY